MLREIIGRLREAGLDVEVCPELFKAISHTPLASECYCMETPSKRARMVLSLGGDGTFLRAARWTMQGSGAPVAGINAGTLGFLAAWERNEFQKLINMAVTHRIPTRQRTLLEVECEAGDKIGWPLALNDVSLLRSKTSQMITVSATLDGDPLADYTGDGLIVCTATGSTGYNLSAGGPILQPETKAIVLTPVAPHTLTQRPLVIDGNSQLRLKVSGRSRTFMLSIDGCSCTLPNGSAVTVRRAAHALHVVHNPEGNFAARLQAKLMWGTNPVDR